MSALLLTGAFALGTGILNALNASEQNERVDKYIELLEDTKYDELERATKIDSVEDLFNTKIMEERNRAAPKLALSGAVNPEVFQLALESELIGKRQTAVVQTENAIDDFNTKVDLNIARAELLKEGEFESFSTGFVSGAGLGLNVASLANTITQENRSMDLLDEYLGKDNFAPTNNLEPFIVPKLGQYKLAG